MKKNLLEPIIDLAWTEDEFEIAPFGDIIVDCDDTGCGGGGCTCSCCCTPSCCDPPPIG